MACGLRPDRRTGGGEIHERKERSVLRSLRMAERAMQIQQMRLDTLANNLANVDAAGFKQVLTRVAEKGVGQTPEAEQKGTTAMGLLRPGGEANWASARELSMRQALDARPGPLRPTGRPTDLALLGDGYFVVQTENGERYTRNGSFRLNSQRRLVTADGNPVAGSGGPLSLEGESFSVGRDGSVLVDGALIGRLKIVRFEQPERLQHRGNSLLAAPADMPAAPVAKEKVHVEQGQLEGSNVDPIATLVNMIAAQRAFEIEAKVLQANDQTLDRSVNELGKVK